MSNSHFINNATKEETETTERHGIFHGKTREDFCEVSVTFRVCRSPSHFKTYVRFEKFEISMIYI